MDANLQRPYQVAFDATWDSAHAAWDAQSRMARLDGARTATWNEDTAAGEARVVAAPSSIDAFSTRARVEKAGARWRVVASGGAPGETVIVDDIATEITDVAIGRDDAVYLAIGDRVRMHDLRGRWNDVEVAIPGGVWRLAAGARGCYTLAGRTADAPIGRVIGFPMRPLPYEHGPTVFRPRPEDDDPPRFEVIASAPPGVTPVAIATSPSGRLALLAWDTGTAGARLYLREGDAWSAPRVLVAAKRPYSLAWLDENRIAVLVATQGGGTTAGVYTIAKPGDASLVGDLFPLRAPTAAPFLHGATPPRYASDGDVVRPLVPVSWPAFVESGTLDLTEPLDSTVHGHVWHRIYLEAAIPAGTSIVVRLAASDREGRDHLEWFEHRFGGQPPATSEVPTGVWVDAPSEMPYATPMLTCPSRAHVAGLFTALVQRAHRRTRVLAGRYLYVQVELRGDGRATPELAAVRIYGNRRGYASLYLPELYRESVFGTDANEAADATPADFLDRFLGMFEGVLTPLEDRIANAWLLTNPRTVPAEALDWLASWLGFVFAADLPERARRAMLENAWKLYKQRGTLAGLSLALELATRDDDDVGGVARGEIVVIEDFRLRRTFSTILGADLENESDPLLPGLSISGNSIVGETLFLGAEGDRDFLALFAPGLTAESEIREFFDRLAHRATVLVHQEMREQDLGLIRQIIELEAPAHVEVKIVPATYRFRVAVSSLVGVDTFLAPKPQPGAVILDRSDIGVRDVIERLPSLDPRLGRTS